MIAKLRPSLPGARRAAPTDEEISRDPVAVVADIGLPSLGVGGEIASACLSGQPVIAVHSTDQRPSRHTRGQILTR